MNNTGTYAAVTFDKKSIVNLYDYVTGLDIPNPLDPELYHSTIVYSKKTLPELVAVHYGALETKISHFRIFEAYCQSGLEDGREPEYVLVAVLDNPLLSARHKQIREVHGAAFDFDEYIPHITLSYDVGPDFDMEGLPSFDDTLIITGEYVEHLDDDIKF